MQAGPGTTPPARANAPTSAEASRLSCGHRNGRRGFRCSLAAPPTTRRVTAVSKLDVVALGAAGGRLCAGGCLHRQPEHRVRPPLVVQLGEGEAARLDGRVTLVGCRRQRARGHFLQRRERCVRGIQTRRCGRTGGATAVPARRRQMDVCSPGQPWGQACQQRDSQASATRSFRQDGSIEGMPAARRHDVPVLPPASPTCADSSNEAI